MASARDSLYRAGRDGRLRCRRVGHRAGYAHGRHRVAFRAARRHRHGPRRRGRPSTRRGCYAYGLRARGVATELGVRPRGSPARPAFSTGAAHFVILDPRRRAAGSPSSTRSPGATESGGPPSATSTAASPSCWRQRRPRSGGRRTKAAGALPTRAGCSPAPVASVGCCRHLGGSAPDGAGSAGADGHRRRPGRTRDDGRLLKVVAAVMVALIGYSMIASFLRARAASTARRLDVDMTSASSSTSWTAVYVLLEAVVGDLMMRLRRATPRSAIPTTAPSQHCSTAPGRGVPDSHRRALPAAGALVAVLAVAEVTVLLPAGYTTNI